ncbi:MAG: response regulator [Chloroflexota bacterium]|nr:response regulator [Chloroflexota bacterium]
MPGPKHVLVVEDDQAIRNLIQDLLSGRGYSVAVADNGAKALDLMHQRRPDLVVLDLVLPDMNGWSFLRQRNSDRDLARVPVLVVSAVGPRGSGEARDLGAPVFIGKPFDNERLLSEVERLCTGVLRQCAWCRRVMDSAGKFRLRSTRKLHWASHGICPGCKTAQKRALLN